MSTLPENELDLEKLFLPAWAQEQPSAAKYAHYEGERERPDYRDSRRGPRPPRRDGGPGGNRPDSRPGGQRFGGPGGPPRGSGGDRAGRPGRGERPGAFRDDRRERREPPPPLPELNVSLVPEEKGVESLARQIKITGRAYPLFDIAQLILQKPERHQVAFSVMKNAEGKPIQPLFLCALDDTLWLSEDEAVAHILKKHFSTFYQAERTATEPPKGKYTFVAQCGMSGVTLGPPNYHDYQNQLRKLHAERFSRMPFEVYKSRVRIVRDEEVVKKWVDDQSWKTDYLCLNLPEAVRLGSMEAVEKHFRETHKENIVKAVESHKMNGAAARNLRSPELTRLVRTVTEDQRRFPLQIATVLSQQFASHGLQFFKVNKTITHVAIARPHYLDLVLTPVSDGVKRIVDYINAHPKCTRRLLVESLAPSPAPATVVPVTPPAPESAGEAPAAPQPSQGPTPEQTAIVADLHWLVHEGHVIEFANGLLECAKKPLPKPPRPERPKVAEAAAQPEGGATASPAAEATQTVGESVPDAPPASVEAQAGAVAEAQPPAPDAQPPAEPEPPAQPDSQDVQPGASESDVRRIADDQPVVEAPKEAPPEPPTAPVQSP